MSDSRKSSEVEKIFNELQKQIIQGELPPGHRLVEAQLAARFGVSRTPARLAIERLAAVGLVDHQTNRGATVHRLSFDELRELLYIRQINEGLIADMAAAKRTEEDVSELWEILSQMKTALEAEGIHTYSSLSSQLHSKIMDIADNRFLTDFVRGIYMITSPYHMAITSLPNRAEQSFNEHYAVVEAIAAKDGNAANQSMVRHIAIITDFFDSKYSQVYYQLHTTRLEDISMKHESPIGSSGKLEVK